MNEIIFRYPGQKFVGLASKQVDGTLTHLGYTLLDVLPKKGDTLFEREVLEVVSDEDVLKEPAEGWSLSAGTWLTLYGRCGRQCVYVTRQTKALLSHALHS